MKKLLFTLSAALVVTLGVMVAVWHYAPVLAFRLIGKAIGGSVIVADSKIVYKDGLLILTLKGVRAKGMVEGNIENCEVQLLLAKGIYVKHLAISDFEVSVQKEQGALKFYPVPVEQAEINKGVFNYGGRKYVVREIRVSNFNTGKTMEFSIDAGAEGLGDIKTRGEGLFNGDKRSDINGRHFLPHVDMVCRPDQTRVISQTSARLV